jgi:hypothetical protein
LSSIGKIEDLRVKTTSDPSKIMIEFTGDFFFQTFLLINILTTLNFNIIIEPDFATEIGHQQVVSYEIRFTNNYKDIIDSFDTLANKWVHSNNSFRSDSDYSMNLELSLNLMDEPSLIGRIFYVALKPIVDSVNRPISNVIRVYVPKKNLQSSNNHDLNEAFATDSSIESPFYEDNDEVFRKNQKIAGIKVEVLIPAIVCISLALLLTMCICCCIARKKKCRKSKTKLKSHRNSSINAISAPSPSYNPSAVYLPEPMNGSIHSYSQTVGLPVGLDDEMIKTEFIDHDQHYDEMKLQRHFQQPYYGQVENDTGIKWASYWAAEHEKALSSNPSCELYMDSNLCPQIPDLPTYQSNYGYQISNAPMQLGLGSMQSVVSGAISNDRKIRNITMV